MLHADFSSRSWGACCTEAQKLWERWHGSSLMKSITWEMQVGTETRTDNPAESFGGVDIDRILLWNCFNEFKNLARQEFCKKSVMLSLTNRTAFREFQSVVLCGRRPSFFFLIMCITSSCQPPFPMPDSLLSGFAIFISRWGVKYHYFFHLMYVNKIISWYKKDVSSFLLKENFDLSCFYSHAMSSTPTTVPHRCNTTSSQQGAMDSTWWLMRM